MNNNLPSLCQVFKGLLCIFLFTVLAACDGGRSSSPASAEPAPIPVPAFTVVSTSPADLATSVSRSAAITTTFSEEIHASSIDSNRFTLQSPTGFIAAGVSLAGANATLTPTDTLTLLTPYTVTLSSAISGLSDNTLDVPVSWRFVTEDGDWGAAELIETDDTGDAGAARIAIHPNGAALAVWVQYDGTRYNVIANVYFVGSGWGVAELIETDNAGDAIFPQVAFDITGRGLAVWYQHDGTRFNIWSNRYNAGSGWGVAELIETDNAGTAFFANLAIDNNNGNALAVWVQNDGSRYNVMANRYTLGSGWGTAELIETDNAGDALEPQIAIDNNGNALAVWHQEDGTRSNIVANRYTAGSGWGLAELIETDNNSAGSPQVAIDSNGNALAVWSQWDGARSNIWSNRYSAGSGWGAAELIETDNAGDARFSQIVIDSHGNALAVWDQNDGARANIVANRYTAGSGWGAAELIETDNAGGAFFPQVSIDSNGNALAVWAQNDGSRSNIMASRYSAGSGWGMAELIETDNIGSAGGSSPHAAPQIAIDSNGNALAVWEQSDGTRTNIMSNRLE